MSTLAGRSVAAVFLLAAMAGLAGVPGEVSATAWLSAFSLLLGLVAAGLALRSRSAGPAGVSVVVFALGAVAASIAWQLHGRVPAYWETAALGILSLVWAGLLVSVGERLARDRDFEPLSFTLARWTAVGALLLAGGCVLPSVPVAYGMSAPWALHLGETAAIALCAGLLSALFLTAAKQWRIRAGFFVIVVLSASLGVVADVTVLVALGVAAAWALLMHRRAGQARHAGLAAALALAALVIPVVMLALGEKGASLRAAAAGGLPLDAQGMGIRLALWREALDLALGSPLSGIGWGRFAWAHFEHVAAGVPAELRGSLLQARAFADPHSSVLQLLAETGLASFLVVLVCLALWLRCALRGEATPARWWLLSMLSLLAAGALTSSLLSHLPFLGMIAVLLGMGNAVSIPLPSLARLARPMAVAGTVCGLALLASMALGYRDVREVQTALADDPAMLTLEGWERLERARRVSLMGPLVDQTLMPTEFDAANPAAVKARRALGTRLVQQFPTPPNVYAHVVVLALDGDLHEAEALLRKAALAYPLYYPTALERLKDLAIRYPERVAPLLRNLQVT